MFCCCRQCVERQHALHTPNITVYGEKTYQSMVCLVWCIHESDECTTLMSRHTRQTDLYYDFNFIPTLRQTKPREIPEAAICVRKSSARRVLHFTPLNAASCVLHRPANRVIHRLQLYFIFSLLSHRKGTSMHNIPVWYGHTIKDK